MKYPSVRALSPWIPLTVFTLFLAAIFLRPPLPIDETRYLTVAWESYLNHNWAQLTLNFSPYHHKPPLLFWLINLFWSLFGVSRWAATIPPVLAAVASVYLARGLVCRLFPERADRLYDRVPYLMIGSVPFLIYGTLIMFDVMMMAFILAVLLCLVSYARKRDLRTMVLAGVFLGLAALTKGPVALLYVIFPFLLAPLWMRAEERVNMERWYAGGLVALLVALTPVAVWLFFALRNADGDFAFWLLWNQTAGRITGNFSASHARPFYFYLMLLPVLVLPWAFFPAFWRGAKASWNRAFADLPGVRFILCWIVPVFVSFCLIKGKQPHYLVPLLPGFVIMTALLLRDVRDVVLARAAAAMVVFIIAGQAVASRTILPAYDLRPVAAYVRDHQDADWAYVSNYHGQVGFLARLEKPVTDMQLKEAKQWLSESPDRRALVVFKEDRDVKDLHEIMENKYRGRRMGIFSGK